MKNNPSMWYLLIFGMLSMINSLSWKRVLQSGISNFKKNCCARSMMVTNRLTLFLQRVIHKSSGQCSQFIQSP